MTRKSDYAFWTFVMLACLAGATTLLNVTRTYSATSTNSEIYKQLDLFGDVLERVRSDYVDKPDDATLIDSAINGMLAALDPHSAYLNPKNFRDMQVQTRGEFGGLGIEVTMENGVVKVVSPIDDTPAAKAGIQSGDVITAVNGEPVKDAKELARTIGGLAPGNAVKLNVLQKGQDKVINLTLGQLPNTIEAKADTDKEDKGSLSKGTGVPKLGLTVAPANSVAGAGKDGVVVTEVDPKSAAAERGFKEGDVILEVGGKSVASVDDVRDAITAARTDNKNSVLMRVKSGGSSRFVAVPLAKG